MKERKKRKKFNIKRTLVYLATYIVVTFGVALFMVMNTSTTLSSGNKLNFTIPEPSAIEKVISSITDNENIEMTASIDVDKDGEPFAKVLFGANVNFGEELTDIKVAADMNATYGDHTITAQARYIDNELYLSVLGGNYKLYVPTAMDAISSVTNLLGVDLDKELSALDTSALAELAADVQEIEDGYIVSLEFNGIKINLTTDAKYNLVSAKISDIEVEGYVIKIKANVVARNNGKVVEAPQDEYVDITDTFAIVESISNTLTEDMFVSAHVAYGDITFDGYINFANLNAFGTLSAGEVCVNVQYKDCFVYADALGAKVKVALADYEKYLDALSAFGIDVNVNVDANQVLDMVTSLSLDVIKNVERVGDSVVVTLTSDEAIVFDVTGDKLNRIIASVGGADAEIVLGNGCAVAPAINEEEYIDALNFLPYVDSIAQIIESKNVAGNITLKFEENEFLFNVCASFVDGFTAQATGNVFGLDVVITYANENIYLDIDDAHIVLHKNQFSELLDLFEVDTQLDLGNLNIALSMQDSKIMASVLGYTFGVGLDSNNIVLNANISGLELSASVCATNDYVVVPTGEYHELDIVAIASQVKDILDSKSFSADINANFMDTTISAHAVVNFEGGISAQISGSAFDKEFVITLQDGVLYVSIDDSIKLQGSVQDLPELIDEIKTVFAGNSNSVGALDIASSLTLKYNGSNFIVALGGFEVFVNVENGIGNVSMQSEQFSAQLLLKFDAQEIVEKVTDIESYDNDVFQFVPTISAINYLINSEHIHGIAQVYIDGELHEFTLHVQHEDGIKAYVSGKLLDKEFKLTYANNLYVNALGFSYYLTSEDMNDIFNGALALVDELPLHIESMQITNFVVREDVVYVVINNEIYIQLILNGGRIDNIQINYNDIDAYIYLNYETQIEINEPSVSSYTRLTEQFDVVNLLDLAHDLIENKQVQISATVNVKEYQLTVEAKVDFANELIAQVSVYYENYKVDVYVQDGKVYVNALDMVYLYDTLSDLPTFIEDIMQLFEVEQLSIENLLDEVQYVSYANGKLQYVHEDIELVANISASNDSVVKLDNVSAYTNKISDLLPFINATKTLIEVEHISANAQVSFDGSEYNATLGYTKFDDKIAATLTTSIKEKQIALTYLENVIYANVFGYKASFDLDNAQPLLDKVFEMLEVEDLDELLEKYDLSMNFDINGIISNFKLTPGKLELTIADEFKVVLNIANDSLDNIQFAYNNITASIVFDYYTPVAINVAGEYDSLNDKVEILDHAQKLVDTYNAIASEYVIDGETYIGYNASFDASVRFGNTTLEGNIQASLVPTKVEDKVENKLYASVYGSLGTLDAKIYLADNVAYVSIQGLKIKIELSKDEIDNVLAWVNDKFDKELAFDSLSNGIAIEIPDLSTLRFEGNANELIVGLGEFKVNTSKFTDIAVKLNSSELLDDIIIATNVYDNNITEIGSADFENAYWENDDTIHKNLAFYLSNFTYGNFVDTITLGDTMLLDGVAQGEFVDYSKVLNFVDALIEYANSGEYAFTLNTTVNEYNPATNQTKLYAKVEDAFFEIHNAKNGTTDSKINIDYFYASGLVTLPNNAKNRTSDYLDHKFSGVLDSRNGDNKLYATYSNAVSNFKNSLKLKIDTNTLMYFASIALKLFDVDSQNGIVSKFANLPNVDDLDVSNLRNLVGVEPVDVSDFEQIDNLLSKAKDYIDKVKSIEFVNRVVNGKEENYLALNIEINDEIMELRINTLDGMLKYIGAENVQVTRARNMNLTLDVTEFKGANNYNKSASHFDLTDLKDLVTSFVNNSKYNDFHITGTLDVSITLAGIIPITLNVPLDAKIKLVDKKPQVMINLTIPVLHPLYNVNDDMNSWSSERTVKIYYADGYLYTYRTEKSGKYEKKVKQELATLGDSIMDYVQYITGLNDDIMKKISEAMDKTINRTTPIDFTDVISNYSYTSSSSAHNITINLKELANNDQLDTATLKLYTSYLNSAKYIQKAELDVEMPVATGVDIAIKATSSSGSKNPLKLVDIGSAVNMSELTNYINSYTYGVDEFWVKNNGGSWKKESDQEYTITFDSLGGASVGDITNKAGTPITLPRISSNKTNTVDNIQYIYSFVGWTLDSMGAGEIVSWTTQPRGNKTLYAVWNIIDTKTLITFVTNSDYSVSSIRASVGASITLPTINGVKNVDGTSERKEYTFAGWYYDSECTNAATITTMPSTNVTLYAKWVLSRTVNIYTVTFVSNGATTYNSIKVEAGTTLDVSGYKPHKHDTTEWIKEKHSGDLIKKYYHYHTHYTFAGWYTNSGLTMQFNGVVNGNITLYGKYTTSVTNHVSTALIPSASQKCDDSCEWC